MAASPWSTSLPGVRTTPPKEGTTMRIKLLPTAVIGMAGLVTAGLIAMPGSAGAEELVKRDEDSADVVLVSDDDDENDDDGVLARDDNTTRSRSGNSGDRSRSGRASGRDDSRSGRQVRDWTRD